MKNRRPDFCSDTGGATTIEYAVIAALVTVALVAFFPVISAYISAALNPVVETLAK
jgi:Flp pilus assembly pilin Flp